MLHTHTISNDEAYEILKRLTELGEESIPTAMTWPHAQFRRTMRARCAAIDDAKQTTLDLFTQWQLDEAGRPKRDENGRNVPRVVYATDATTGAPLFRLDDAGKPTTERLVKHGAIQITDMLAYSRALSDLGKETAEIKVPHLSWPQLASKLETLPPNLVEALMDFFDDPPGAEPTPA